ncbi:hypothetical protein Pint_36490 [Pistacia integerrima]|uniref:Uncharacterized protein n=1 Tax=Pistacia integerrima TaxID=434235 RepID=A0ACC0Y4E7_9ROSI|nr:hypothetical protein Pint_36490 [Pistacia integerrima]
MIGGYAQSSSPVEAIVLFIEAMLSDEIDFDENLATLPVIVLNAIIVMYSRCGFVLTSFKVFDNMLERDVVSWNTMISVSLCFKAAFKPRNRDIGKQTHAYLLRHGIQFEGMESYLIDMYAKSGLIRASQQNFERNHTGDRDQATWNAMIAGYTQNGLVEEALNTFRQMLEQNVTPNVVNIAYVLPACNPMGNIELAIWASNFMDFLSPICWTKMSL